MKPKDGYGFIYVLSNPSFKDAIYKVGLTTNPIKQRIGELSSATGLPTKFKVEQLYEIPAKDLRQVEQESHRRLKHQQSHVGKEFFSCSLQDIKRVIEDVILEYSIASNEPLHDARERQEQRTIRKSLYDGQQAKIDAYNERYFKVAGIHEQWTKQWVDKWDIVGFLGLAFGVIYFFGRYKSPLYAITQEDVMIAGFCIVGFFIIRSLLTEHFRKGAEKRWPHDSFPTRRHLVRCPKCQKPSAISEPYPLRKTIRITCPSCGKRWIEYP